VSGAGRDSRRRDGEEQGDMAIFNDGLKTWRRFHHIHIV
jgi:hypothetical protein